MNILVIDQLNQQRDMAQMDMYRAISIKHSVIFPKDLKWEFAEFTMYEPSVVYLGIMAMRMGLEWKRLINWANKNNTLILIDQADNEEFWIERDFIDIASINRCAILSRYLPNKKMDVVAAATGKPVMLLPWYIDKNRVERPGLRDIDLNFVCSKYGLRAEVDTILSTTCLREKIDLVNGNYFGNLYYKLLGRSKHCLVECARQCLTQKYIEAALNKCVIIGDIPIYPANELKVTPLNFTELALGYDSELIDALKKGHADDVEFNYEYITKTFANPDYFLEHFNKILEVI